jgi:hypothetical protein
MAVRDLPRRRALRRRQLDRQLAMMSRVPRQRPQRGLMNDNYQCRPCCLT